MFGDARAFFALDLGAATTAAALVGRIAGRWRLLGALAFPAGVPVDGILDALVARLSAAEPGLGQELVRGGPPAGWPRLVARSSRPTELAVVASSERALKPLAAAAEQAGWRVRTGSADRLDPLGLTELLLRPEVSTILLGSGAPPGVDERAALAELVEVVAAAASRRPEVRLILAGGMAAHAGRLASAPDGPSEVLSAPAAAAATPAGPGLRELLVEARAGVDESRPAFARAVGSLADAIDRRIEAIELGIDGGVRVHASPARNGEPGALEWTALASAGLVPPEPDDAAVDRVLAWSTVPFDRHRLRDRLRDLRLVPWGGAAGDGAPLRLAAARAAVARLMAGTGSMASLPPADLLVVAGGAWAVAPGAAIALAVSDVVRRPGAAQLAFDHARLLAPLGTVEDAAERASVVADLAGDLLVPLGSVVMPQGMRAGRSGGRLVVHGATGPSEIELVPGGLELVDLPPGEGAVAEFEFRDAVRLGTRGRHFAVDVTGGLGGLLVDLRDVPLRLPDRPDRRRELLAAWQAALWPAVEA